MKRFRIFKHQSGQSLVETAISLPLFLILIVGVVEIGSLLVAQQRVTTATDMGVRFGSRGGTDEGMLVAMQNTLTQTMNIDDPDQWDVFIVRGEINDQGNGWDEFSMQHIYGNQRTRNFTGTITSTFQNNLGTEVLEGLQTRGDTNSGGLVILDSDNSGEAGRDLAANQEVVGMIVYHEVDTILGLDEILDTDVQLTGTSYARLQAVGIQTNGCEAYPLIMTDQARSLDGRESTDYEDQTLNSIYPVNFPEFSEFDPSYGNRLINESLEGDLFVIYETSGFRWVQWDESTSATESMAWPGNSDRYVGYQGLVDNNSGLHRRDLLLGGAAAVPNANLVDHIDLGRPIRVMLIEAADLNDGAPYAIDDFIIMRLHGYGNTNGNTWMLAETVKVDTSCGQIVE
ncbi:MAG: TadE family protein [Chloroflexota bacterium]